MVVKLVDCIECDEFGEYLVVAQSHINNIQELYYHFEVIIDSMDNLDDDGMFIKFNMNYMKIKLENKSVVIMKPRLEESFHKFIDNMKKYTSGKLIIHHQSDDKIPKLFIRSEGEYYTSPIDVTYRRNKEEARVISGYPYDHRSKKVGKIVNLTRRDINTVSEGRWLNDEVINYFMNILRCEYHLGNIEYFQTHWYQKLINEGFDGVKSWHDTTIFDKDIIVIPINKTDCHWSLLLVMNPGKIGDVCNLSGNRRMNTNDNQVIPAIIGLDSTSTGISAVAARRVRGYLNKMYALKQKRGLKFWFDKNSIPLVQRRVPWQNDSYNCGMYVIMFMHLIHKQMRFRKIKFTKAEASRGGQVFTKVLRFNNPTDILLMRTHYKKELERRAKAQKGKYGQMIFTGCEFLR